MGDFKKKLKALAALPDKVRKVLEEKEKVLNMSRVFRYASNFLYLGRGFNFPVALEGWEKYIDNDKYDKLRRIKKVVDKEDVFHARFTIRPEPWWSLVPRGGLRLAPEVRCGS